MSSSKKKKRHANSRASVRTRSQQAVLADQKDRARRRMNPTARNLLFFDLVFLAACQMMYSAGMIGELLSGAATLLGMALLIAALWFQFGKKDMNRSDGTGGPRNNGGWPGL